MKLAEYLAIARKTIDDFDVEFQRGQREDGYPDELDQSEWEEQYLAFMEGRMADES